MRTFLFIMLMFIVVGCIAPTEPTTYKVSKLRESGQRGKN